uniref:Radial spoke head 14 homolog n=1 Tax=Salarias fasciatus TaxID=181472 RepID=A0A672JID4_SALFA
MAPGPPGPPGPSGRAPVAFGRLAVPQLLADLQQPDSGTRLRVLASLLDLIHDPERLYQTVTEGFLQQLKVLLKDKDPSVRTKTCEVLEVVATHSLGRVSLTFQASLSSETDLVGAARGTETVPHLTACRTLTHITEERHSSTEFQVFCY